MQRIFIAISIVSLLMASGCWQTSAGMGGQNNGGGPQLPPTPASFQIIFDAVSAGQVDVAVTHFSELVKQPRDADMLAELMDGDDHFTCKLLQLPANKAVVAGLTKPYFSLLTSPPRVLNEACKDKKKPFALVLDAKRSVTGDEPDALDDTRNLIAEKGDKTTLESLNDQPRLLLAANAVKSKGTPATVGKLCHDIDPSMLDGFFTWALANAAEPKIVDGLKGAHCVTPERINSVFGPAGAAVDTAKLRFLIVTGVVDKTSGDAAARYGVAPHLIAKLAALPANDDTAVAMDVMLANVSNPNDELDRLNGTHTALMWMLDDTKRVGMTDTKRSKAIAVMATHIGDVNMRTVSAGELNNLYTGVALEGDGASLLRVLNATNKTRANAVEKAKWYGAHRAGVLKDGSTVVSVMAAHTRTLAGVDLPTMLNAVVAEGSAGDLVAIMSSIDPAQFDDLFSWAVKNNNAPLVKDPPKRVEAGLLPFVATLDDAGLQKLLIEARKQGPDATLMSKIFFATSAAAKTNMLAWAVAQRADVINPPAGVFTVKDAWIAYAKMVTGADIDDVIAAATTDQVLLNDTVIAAAENNFKRTIDWAIANRATVFAPGVSAENAFLAFVATLNGAADDVKLQQIYDEAMAQADSRFLERVFNRTNATKKLVFVEWGMSRVGAIPAGGGAKNVGDMLSTFVVAIATPAELKLVFDLARLHGGRAELLAAFKLAPPALINSIFEWGVAQRNDDVKGPAPQAKVADVLVEYSKTALTDLNRRDLFNEAINNGSKELVAELIKSVPAVQKAKALSWLTKNNARLIAGGAANVSDALATLVTNATTKPEIIEIYEAVTIDGSRALLEKLFTATAQALFADAAEWAGVNTARPDATQANRVKDGLMLFVRKLAVEAHIVSVLDGIAKSGAMLVLSEVFTELEGIGKVDYLVSWVLNYAGANSGLVKPRFLTFVTTLNAGQVGSVYEAIRTKGGDEALLKDAFVRTAPAARANLYAWIKVHHAANLSTGTVAGAFGDFIKSLTTKNAELDAAYLALADVNNDALKKAFMATQSADHPNLFVWAFANLAQPGVSNAMLALVGTINDQVSLSAFYDQMLAKGKADLEQAFANSTSTQQPFLFNWAVTKSYTPAATAADVRNVLLDHVATIDEAALTELVDEIILRGEAGLLVDVFKKTIATHPAKTFELAVKNLGKNFKHASRGGALTNFGVLAWVQTLAGADLAHAYKAATDYGSAAGGELLNMFARTQAAEWVTLVQWAGDNFANADVKGAFAAFVAMQGKADTEQLYNHAIGIPSADILAALFQATANLNWWVDWSVQHFRNAKVAKAFSSAYAVRSHADQQIIRDRFVAAVYEAGKNVDGNAPGSYVRKDFENALEYVAQILNHQFFSPSEAMGFTFNPFGAVGGNAHIIYAVLKKNRDDLAATFPINVADAHLNGDLVWIVAKPVMDIFTLASGDASDGVGGVVNYVDLNAMMNAKANEGANSIEEDLVRQAFIDAKVNGIDLLTGSGAADEEALSKASLGMTP